MPTTEKNATHLKSPSLHALKQQLRASLQLDLDDFNLEANSTGEYTSDFAGMHLESAFQAIYDVHQGDFHGHEALLRPKLGNIQEVSPDFAFTYADESGKLVKLDRVSRTLHVLNYHEIFQEKDMLFLNIHPSLPMSVNEHGKVFEQILHDNSIATQRVVIEIRDFDTFKLASKLAGSEEKLEAAVNNYQARGYKIAIDNFGNTHSLVSRLWKLKPDYVKFDRHLTREAEHDATAQKALFGLVNLVKALDAQPVITGVESHTHLHIGIDAGAALLQGYLFGKPSSARQLNTSDIMNRHAAQQVA